MSIPPESWKNLISYPDFEVETLDESSLFWRVETPHSFYTLESEAGKLKISNFYHEPVVIKNGMWGSRLFLEEDRNYTIGIRYRSNTRLYLGLYQADSKAPCRVWVLDPAAESMEWQESFSVKNFGGKDCPLHIRITVPDTKGEVIEMNGLHLSETEPKGEALPDVAVGIVTFNRKDHLRSLLNRLKDLNYPENRVHIHVVDNASSDGTKDMLKEEFPHVTVLRNRVNSGGSGGFNRFFNHLSDMEDPPEYSWLVDDDAQIEKNSFIHLARALMDDPSVAIAGSVMMDLDSPSTVYEAGGDLFRDRFGWKANILQADAGTLDHIREKNWTVGYAGAYSLGFRTEIIKEAGIWRDYFLHVDDSEWCLRVQRITGKKAIICLDSLIWHVLQGARKPFTFLRYYETRNFLDYFESRGDRKALMKVMLQTVLMGLKQLSIKREDLYGFHMEGISDFFKGRLGKKSLQRSALILPDIESVIRHYNTDRGRMPGKLFLVREINDYINDGTDQESSIMETVRGVSPETLIIEASANSSDSALRACDGFISLKPPFKPLLFFKMARSILMPSRGIVVLPFWNESVIANNLAEFTAVYENGKFSLYRTGRTAFAARVIKTFSSTLYRVVKMSRRPVKMG